jgi:hypothetical protein
MLIPLEIPPGLYRQGTEYQSKGRFYEANLWRWAKGKSGPVGGWELLVSFADPATTISLNVPVVAVGVVGAGLLVTEGPELVSLNVPGEAVGVVGAGVSRIVSVTGDVSGVAVAGAGVSVTQPGVVEIEGEVSAVAVVSAGVSRIVSVTGDVSAVAVASAGITVEAGASFDTDAQAFFDACDTEPSAGATAPAR